MVDCQFERQVCQFFKIQDMPNLMVLGMDKVYQIKTLKTRLLKEDFLALLSGEDYKQSADVWKEDTQ